MIPLASRWLTQLLKKHALGSAAQLDRRDPNERLAVQGKGETEPPSNEREGE